VVLTGVVDAVRTATFAGVITGEAEEGWAGTARYFPLGTTDITDVLWLVKGRDPRHFCVTEKWADDVIADF
jgi:hypothetical protein